MLPKFWRSLPAWPFDLFVRQYLRLYGKRDDVRSEDFRGDRGGVMSLRPRGGRKRRSRLAEELELHHSLHSSSAHLTGNRSKEGKMTYTLTITTPPIHKHQRKARRAEGDPAHVVRDVAVDRRDVQVALEPAVGFEVVAECLCRGLG